MNSHAIQLVVGALNMVSDFSILILPMPLVWSLQLDRAKKLKVMGIFGVGILACAASIIRLYYLVKLLYLPVESTYDLLLVCRIGVWAYVFPPLSMPNRSLSGPKSENIAASQN